MDQAGRFFEEFSNKFDTIYDGKRNIFMRWLDHNFRRSIFVRFDLTFEFLNDLTDKAILDVGCGSGPYIAEALKRGAKHVMGIDAARNMLDLARERVTHLGMLNKVSFLEGYFPEVLPTEKFDFGIAMGVMDYIQYPVVLLKNLKPIINKRLVISFPGRHWYRTPIRKFRYKLRHCPVYFYNPEIIQKIMQESEIKHYQVIKIAGAGADYFVCIYL